MKGTRDSGGAIWLPNDLRPLFTNKEVLLGGHHLTSKIENGTTSESFFFLCHKRRYVNNIWAKIFNVNNLFWVQFS